MPIINMASSREQAEANGVNVRSITTPASKYVGTDAEGKSVYETVDTVIWLYDTHVGVCLEDREENGRDDSDWYMLVWDEEKACIEKVYFATTRGWSYPCYGSKSDATPEVRAKADEFLRQMTIASAIRRDKDKAREVCEGRLVEVVAGRKLAKGSRWLVYRKVENTFKRPKFGGYGFYRPEYRVCLKAVLENGERDWAAELVWTDAKNVAVVNPEQFETPEENIHRQYENWKPSTYATSCAAGFVMM